MHGLNSRRVLLCQFLWQFCTAVIRQWTWAKKKLLRNLPKKQLSCLGANDENSTGAYLVRLLSQKSFRYFAPSQQTHIIANA